MIEILIINTLQSVSIININIIYFCEKSKYKLREEPYFSQS